MQPAVWTPIVSAGAAILGALVTGGFAVFLAERQAARVSGDRRRERAEARANEEAKAAEAAAHETLSICRHLEAYAKECADVTIDPFSPERGFPRSTPQLKAYPAVHWPRVGARATAQALDLIERNKLRLGYIRGDAHEEGSDREAAARIYGDGAARLGLEAWRVASSLRRTASLPDFDFPEDGWNFAEALQERADAAEVRA